jgi:thiol-disulfide isomerase/thioredoxin
MNKKIKILLGISGMVVLIAIATVAYKTLGSRMRQNEAVMIARGEAAISGEDRQEAPDFAMTDMEGNTVRLSDIIANGKPIVLNFWASWCPPCKIEMPEFNKVYLEMGDEVQFMMVDLTDGVRETVRIGTKYIEDNKFSFLVFFVPEGEGAMYYGIRSIPTTLFIDKDGYVVTGVQGAIDESTLRKGIGFIN